MSRVKVKYRPELEQAESRQLLSTVLRPSIADSHAQHARIAVSPIPSAPLITKIGDAYVGNNSASPKAIYAASVTNNSGLTLKITSVDATSKGTVANFKAGAQMIDGGRIFIWSDKPDSKVTFKFSAEGAVPPYERGFSAQGSKITPADFMKPGNSGWTSDFSLAEAWQINAVKNPRTGAIVGLKAELTPK